VILALEDGRVLLPVLAAGRLRLMAVEAGKEPLSLIHTDEETSPPMALAGPGRVASTIGPPPHRTIALAEIETGRVVTRIALDKGEIGSLTASPDGATLYFAAGGAIWAVPSSGGESRRIAAGSSAIMRPGGRSLVIERVEPERVHLFEVPTDGSPEREIWSERDALYCFSPAESSCYLDRKADEGVGRGRGRPPYARSRAKLAADRIFSVMSQATIFSCAAGGGPALRRSGWRDRVSAPRM
jgi:hypothetical protein